MVHKLKKFNHILFKDDSYLLKLFSFLKNKKNKKNMKTFVNIAY